MSDDVDELIMTNTAVARKIERLSQDIKRGGKHLHYTRLLQHDSFLPSSCAFVSQPTSTLNQLNYCTPTP
jgi:hypothetical protein